MNENKMFTSPIVKISMVLSLSVLIFSACSQQSLQGAGRGAVTGAAVGAVGGMVSALVFGGDVGDAAARGAVWGGSTGAAAGAISGAAANSSQKKAQQQAQQAKQEQELEMLKKQLGDDTFNGLTALVDCKHDIAQGYGRTAAQSKNPDHALAGLWVQVLAYADNRQEDQARALFPDLVAKDDKLASESQAETDMQEALQGLKTIRKEYDLPQDCS